MSSCICREARKLLDPSTGELLQNAKKEHSEDKLLALRKRLSSASMYRQILALRNFAGAPSVLHADFDLGCLLELM